MGSIIKVASANFLLGVTDRNKFPDFQMPEVAFIGRSNVGKSSLINSLVLRKNLARISSEPGKTREINFFCIDDAWILVDMPGLGYATIGKAHREKWAALNYYYLENRECLNFTCILIDGRHNPMQTDISLIEHLENLGKDYLIVLTKCDKLSNAAILERKSQLENLTSLCEHCIEVLPYSSVTNMGRNDLFGIIRRRLLDKKNIEML
jgi:GTP-binding protein